MLQVKEPDNLNLMQKENHKKEIAFQGVKGKILGGKVQAKSI